MKNKPQYIVIGSNNFWYATVNSLKEARIEADLIARNKADYFSDELETPEEIYIYKAHEIETFIYNDHNDDCTCPDCSSIS